MLISLFCDETLSVIVEEVEQLKSADKTLDETITVSSEVKDLQGKTLL